MRFQKAVEAAPPFCLEHTRQVCAGGAAPRFRRIQLAHLSRLRNQLAQEELRGQESAETIEELRRVLRRSHPERGQVEQPGTRAKEADHEVIEERELARWDAERQLEHLGKLESEVAARRYRNAVLERENRAFRLAHAAVEGLREDLERERQTLASRNHGAGPKRGPEEK